MGRLLRIRSEVLLRFIYKWASLVECVLFCYNVSLALKHPCSPTTFLCFTLTLTSTSKAVTMFSQFFRTPHQTIPTCCRDCPTSPSSQQSANARIISIGYQYQYAVRHCQQQIVHTFGCVWWSLRPYASQLCAGLTLEQNPGPSRIDDQSFRGFDLM